MSLYHYIVISLYYIISSKWCIYKSHGYKKEKSPMCVLSIFFVVLRFLSSNMSKHFKKRPLLCLCHSLRLLSLCNRDTKSMPAKGILKSLWQANHSYTQLGLWSKQRRVILPFWDREELCLIQLMPMPMWVFPKIGVPPKSSILIGFSKNRWFWGVPLFLETPMWNWASRTMGFGTAAPGMKHFFWPGDAALSNGWFGGLLGGLGNNEEFWWFCVYGATVGHSLGISQGFSHGKTWSSLGAELGEVDILRVWSIRSLQSFQEHRSIWDILDRKCLLGCPRKFVNG